MNDPVEFMHMRAPILMTSDYYSLRLGVTILERSRASNSAEVETYSVTGSIRQNCDKGS